MSLTLEVARAHFEDAHTSLVFEKNLAQVRATLAVAAALIAIAEHLERRS